jgi:outer membrane lipoprotein SlyB
MKKFQLIILMTCALAAISLVTGCATSASSQSFPRGQVRTAFDVEYGEVLSTSVVEIEGEATIIGPMGGSAVGSALGRGNSSRWFSGERRIQGAIGGVAGAIAGEAIERKIRTSDGLLVTVQLDNDDIVSVVQGMDVEFAEGDQVRVLWGQDGSMRVQHL